MVISWARTNLSQRLGLGWRSSLWVSLTSSVSLPDGVVVSADLVRTLLALGTGSSRARTLDSSSLRCLSSRAWILVSSSRKCMWRDLIAGLVGWIGWMVVAGNAAGVAEVA